MSKCPFPTARAGLTAIALLLALPAFAQTSAAPAGTAPAPAASASPVDPNKVVARVNGAPITEADLALAAEDPALNLPGTNPAQKRDILIGYDTCESSERVPL